MRIVLFAVAAFLAAAGIASAQVAAPSLNTTPSIGAVPFNPGLLAWSGPSRIGLGYGQAKLDQSGTVSPAAKGDLKQVQALLAGETFAIGAAADTLKLDVDASLGGGTFEIKGRTLALGAQFAQRVAVGLAHQKGQRRSSGSDETETLPSVGVGVRLIGSWYVGAAGGTATVTDNLAVPATEFDRGVLHYGLAYYWREKERGVHLEVFHAKRDAGPSTSMIDEQQTDGFVAEAVLANWLIGYAGADSDLTKPDGSPGDTQKESNVSLGYVPAPGLAIVLNHSKFKRTDTVGSETSIENTHAGVALQF
jgi:hypothetical protein